MTDEFTLTIDGDGEQQNFNAKLLVQGYTHRFCVTVNETEIFFEPDEEGHYRAIKMPWQEEKQIQKISKHLLQQIRQKIEAILTYDNTECIELTEEGISINHELCSTCTHCIAVCPEQAVSWNHIPSQKIQRELLPTSEQLKEFLKSRRSDFHFDGRRIDREILKEIAVMGKYSPTNNYELDAIIVDSPEVMSALEEICFRKLKIIKFLFFKLNPLSLIVKWLTPDFKKIKPKLKSGGGKKEFFSGAAALIIVIGDSRIRYTELSAQYFLYNMQLYAKTLGIGSRPSGGGKFFLAGNSSAKKILGIPRHKSIQAILFLGYPSIQYVNKAEGIAPAISFK